VTASNARNNRAYTLGNMWNSTSHLRGLTNGEMGISSYHEL